MLAAGRAISVGCLMAAFGGLLVRTFLAPAALSARTVRLLDRACWAGLASALLGSLLWLVLQTCDLAGAAGPDDLGAVLAETQFGHLLTWRVAWLCLAAVAFAVRRRAAACCLAGLALVLQAGHSHAQAMYGPGWLLLSSALHLLACGAWLGSLMPLLVICACEPPLRAREAARRFSPLGIACVATIAVTAAIQSMAWIGDPAGLLGTGYGLIALLKACLFAVMVLFAAGNRRGHARAPELFGEAGRGRLVRTIALEAGLGLAVVLAASVLSELPPAMHVQKEWPFAWTVSLNAVREDPEYRSEALLALVAWAAAGGLMLGGLLLLRGRIGRRFGGGAACAAGLLIAGAAAPHFAPLLVPAVPTEYYRSTAGYAAAGIASGEVLYASHCAVCHGSDGHGDGLAAHGLALPPADLTAPHLFMHGDGQLFWWIRHGMEAADGSLAMPGFAGLSDDETWSLIDFLRARNRGLATRGDGRAVAVAAPDFPVSCPDGTATLAGRHGRAWGLAFGPAGRLPGLSTVLVSSAATPATGACVAESADAPGILRAYAIATGLPGLSGGMVLIDANGWLRMAWPGRLPADAALHAAIAFMAAHPVGPMQAAGMQAGMGM